MGYQYPKSVRLRTRRQYQRLSHQAIRHIGQWIIIDMRTNRFNKTRLGITVSKKYGKAHKRNRFKRVVREAFRQCRLQLREGFDLNVKPRNGAYGSKSSDIQADFLRLISASIS
jgi:ribonuclease P protein component